VFVLEKGKNMWKVLSALLLSFNLFAADLYFCSKSFDSLPVQAGGRVKPFYVLAKETLKHISGKTSFAGLSASEVFCLKSLQSMGLKNSIRIPLKVEHIKSKELLGIENEIMADEALLQKDLIRSEWMRLKENNAYKKDLNKVLSRIQFYDQMIQGQLWTFPNKVNEQITWQSLPDYVTESKINKLQETSSTPFQTLFEQAKYDYIQLNSDTYLLELTYSRVMPFTWSMLLTLLGIICLVALRKPKWGVIFVSFTLILETMGMGMRIFISGRAPITNMYETVMFSGFGALFLATIIYFYKREKIYLIGGLAYNMLCLLMMKFANNMLDPSIQTLVPVLRDNFWLSTHVTTIILSYAALALSWILANIVIIQELKSPMNNADKKYYVDLIYTCMKYGVVLLSAGIILGGVWADYSWGRFWGWDPKETWSLIVLLIYMAILHGKYTNWINNRNFIPFVAAAFMSVMMAWFGVNYILATGLHSYGFSEGGAIFLGSFFAAQTLILIASIMRTRLKSTTAN
jgi:cytochrome c-type biogenesis protein CcsB